MFSPQNYVKKTSSPPGFHYNFSPGTAYTFGSSKSSPSNHSVSVNSSPGAVYIGNSSPDNPAHKGRSCPVIGSNNGSPQISDDKGSVNCSYNYGDFQDTSDLQIYLDNFGPDAGFHDTMKEYCSRSDKESSEDCKLWSSQYPDKTGYHSNSSSNSTPSVNSKKNRRMYHSDDSDNSKNSKHHSEKHELHGQRQDDPDNEGNGFWIMLVIIILIVLIIWIVYDYRRRYHGGHNLGGMGIGGMGANK